jgi:hypothetical protein
MEFPSNHIEALTAIQNFVADHASDLPEDVRALIITATSQPSPVDTIVSVGELLYARRADLGNEARELAAGCISFAALNGWHGLALDGRGAKIVGALRRELGHDHPSGEWPAAEDDPEPLAQYVAAPPEEDAPEGEGE